MKLPDLVRLAMEKSGEHSLSGFGRLIGFSHVQVHHWMNERNFPDFETLGEMAILAGLDPIKTAAEIRLQAPEGKRHGRFLRRLASAAAAMVAAVIMSLGLVSPKPLNAQEFQAVGWTELEPSRVIIMRTIAGMAAKLLAMLFFGWRRVFGATGITRSFAY